MNSVHFDHALFSHANTINLSKHKK